MTILGISIGTALTGACILRDGVLLDRNIHGYHDSWSDRKSRSILNKYKQYVIKHKVTGIIVKVPAPEKHTNAIKTLIKRIESLAQKHNCEFDLITKSELKHRTGARSTSELIAYTTLLYPELSPLFDRGIADGHRYNRRIYKAVISAYLFQQRLYSRESGTASTIQ